MDLSGLIVTLLVGAIAGFLAGKIWQGSGFGALVNIGIGIIGSVVAGYLLPNILPIGGILGSIISATIGALIVLWVVNFIKGRS